MPQMHVNTEELHEMVLKGGIVHGGFSLGFQHRHLIN